MAPYLRKFGAYTVPDFLGARYGGNFARLLGVMVLIAPGFGGTIPVRPAMLADYFGTRYFGAVNGSMVLVQTLGAFFGPLVVGWVVDVTGVYTYGWLACGVVSAVAVPLVLLATTPHHLVAEFRPVSRAERRAEAAASGDWPSI